MADPRGASRRRRREPRFEVVPMIDVFMIVTLFLMVMAFLPQISEALKAELPSSRASEKSPPATVVQILEDGTLQLEGNAIAPEAFEARIRRLRQDKDDLAVVVAADKRLAFDKVVSVIDRLKASGVQRVGLATSRGGDATLPRP
ncbi:MAG: biopolymer transporter ExbD [Candidatus Sericytochromatia bacterium]|nr:biopolymer transporter ExbD [Candidatus Sericytochromatia bacterium]